MGGYDLYGNYYSREIDAMNAEMAQCADIDRHHRQKKDQNIIIRLYALEQRVKHLENQLSNKSFHSGQQDKSAGR